KFYERLLECEQRGSAEFSSSDKLRLCRCYQFTGKQTRARALCDDLLSKEEVRSDSELLSDLYGNLASGFDKTSAQERVALSRLSIECLPGNSSQLSIRYRELCLNLIKVGHFRDAVDALAKAKEHTVAGSVDSGRLDSLRALLLNNMSDFRGAAECL